MEENNETLCKQGLQLLSKSAIKPQATSYSVNDLPSFLLVDEMVAKPSATNSSLDSMFTDTITELSEKYPSLFSSLMVSLLDESSVLPLAKSLSLEDTCASALVDKSTRFCWRGDQLEILNNTFNHTPHPSKKLRENLANILSVDKIRVSHWFKNKRKREMQKKYATRLYATQSSPISIQNDTSVTAIFTLPSTQNSSSNTV